MATEAPTLDPRVEELLRDIAADPRARLFTCDVEKLARGLGQVRVDASLSTAGLTNAERQLLTIGREEVARLLLIAFRERLEEEQDGSFVYSHARMPQETWKSRATRALEQPFDGEAERIDLARRAAGGEAMTTRDLLEACVKPTGTSPVDRSHLLAASQRLADRPTTRIYLAIDFAMKERWEAVAHVLAHQSKCRVGVVETYHAMEWWAVFVERNRTSMDAFDAYLDAYRFGSAHGAVKQQSRLSILSAFFVVATFGPPGSIDKCASQLAGSPPDDLVDRRFVSRLQMQDRARNSPQGTQRTLLLRRQDSFTGVAREIIDVATR
jgi:hypothetical protein